MSFRTLFVIALALGCGLLSAVGFSLVLAGQRALADPGTTESTPVLVTRIEIPRGRLLAPEMLEVKSWPKDLVPPGVLTKPEDANQRASLQTMIPGEPVFEAKLAKAGAIGGMASLIPSGKRAYTVQTKTMASNVAGFVLPGNLVDVLLTFRSLANDETGGGSTTTLLQAVEVLAVGKQIATAAQGVDAQEVESVTLLVTPEQVARLDLGQSLGMLSLALRNPEDLHEAETSPATIADIRFRRMKPAIDAEKMKNLLGSMVSAFRGVLPRSAPQTSNVSAATETQPEPKATSILTLRGQTWGVARVSIPTDSSGPSQSGR